MQPITCWLSSRTIRSSNDLPFLLATFVALVCAGNLSAQTQTDVGQERSILELKETPQASSRENASPSYRASTPATIQNSFERVDETVKTDSSSELTASTWTSQPRSSDDPQSGSFVPQPPAGLLQPSEDQGNPAIDTSPPQPPAFQTEVAHELSQSNVPTNDRLDSSSESGEEPTNESSANLIKFTPKLITPPTGTFASNQNQQDDPLRAPPIRGNLGGSSSFGDRFPKVDSEAFDATADGATQQLPNSLRPRQFAAVPEVANQTPALPANALIRDQTSEPAMIAPPQQRQRELMQNQPGRNRSQLDPNIRTASFNQASNPVPSNPALLPRQGGGAQGNITQQPMASPRAFDARARGGNPSLPAGRSNPASRAFQSGGQGVAPPATPSSTVELAAQQKSQQRAQLKAALRPAGALIRRFDLEQHRTIPGTPVTLLEMMREPISTQTRDAMVQQYWETYYDWSAMLVAEEHQNWAKRLPAGRSAVDQSMVDTANRIAQDRLLAAQVQMGKSQSRLLDFFANARAEDFLPIPADRPIVAPYDTHYDQHRQYRNAPSSLRGIDQMLGGTIQLIARRGSTVQAARQARDSALAGIATGQVTPATAIQAAETCRRAELDLVASVVSYNQAIGHYVVTVTPGGAAEKVVYSMLGRRGLQTQASPRMPTSSVASDQRSILDRTPGQFPGNRPTSNGGFTDGMGQGMSNPSLMNQNANRGDVPRGTNPLDAPERQAMLSDLPLRSMSGGNSRQPANRMRQPSNGAGPAGGGFSERPTAPVGGGFSSGNPPSQPGGRSFPAIPGGGRSMNPAQPISGGSFGG